MRRRKSAAWGKLKAANQEEQIHTWRNFKNLFGTPPPQKKSYVWTYHENYLCQQNIKLWQFTPEEFDVALRKIKNRRAAGLDEIPPEVW